MLLTIPLILLTCGLSLANAWVSGHAEELAVQQKPQRAWLPKSGFWLSVIGLSATLFTILLPVLASFVHLETDGGYINPFYFIRNLWPLFLVLSAALAVNLMMLVNSVRAPKPKASLGQGPRRYGYYGYPRSFFIFMPMRSHRRIAYSPRYYPAVSGAHAASGMAGGMGNGYARSMAGGMGGAYPGGAAQGAMSGGMGAGAGGSGYRGMSGGMGGGANAGSGMSGGMGGSGGKKSSYKSDNKRSMDGNAGLVMLAVMAIAGGYKGAKAVKKAGGKRQAEINHLWRTAEAQRVIREHDEEQERKLQEQFAAVSD
jgi:hypothetical protein